MCGLGDTRVTQLHRNSLRADHLAERGAGLKAGEIVMTGSVMKTVFPEQDANFRFDLEEVGSVEVQVS